MSLADVSANTAYKIIGGYGVDSRSLPNSMKRPNHDEIISSEVILCPISYCRDVFSPYLGKILDFVVVHWSFIFVSHVSRLIVEFI